LKSHDRTGKQTTDWIPADFRQKLGRQRWNWQRTVHVNVEAEFMNGTFLLCGFEASVV